MTRRTHIPRPEMPGVGGRGARLGPHRSSAFVMLDRGCSRFAVALAACPPRGLNLDILRASANERDENHGRRALPEVESDALTATVRSDHNQSRNGATDPVAETRQCFEAVKDEVGVAEELLDAVLVLGEPPVVGRELHAEPLAEFRGAPCRGTRHPLSLPAMRSAG